jgi:hypothetical protein
MLNSYRWSSYPAYVGTVKKPEWLSIDFIYELFGIEPLFASLVVMLPKSNTRR